MKKYLKTAIIACIAVCMIACAGIFASACTDTSKYVITVVSAEDNTPVEGVKIQFCTWEDGKIKFCLPPKNTTYDGNKATVDLSTTELTDNPVFHIDLTSENYKIAESSEYKFDNDGKGIIVDTQTHGYSITIKVEAVS